MKYLKLASLLFAIALLFSSCEKNKNELPLDFKFVLLDTLDNEKTEFSYGENIIFSFQIKNNSSEKIAVNNFLPNNDFFKVYQLSTSEGVVAQGKSYDLINELGAFFIPGNDTFEFKCPWKSSTNSSLYAGYLIPIKEQHTTFLPIGKYYSEFTESFSNGEIQTEEKHFNINFTVK